MIKALYRSSFNPGTFRLGLWIAPTLTAFFAIFIRAAYMRFGESVGISLMNLNGFLLQYSLLPLLYLWFILDLHAQFQRAYWPRYMIARSLSPGRMALLFWLLCELTVPLYLGLVVGTDALVDLLFGAMVLHNPHGLPYLLYLMCQALAHMTLVSLILATAAWFKRFFPVILLTHFVLLLNFQPLFSGNGLLHYFFWQLTQELEYLFTPPIQLREPLLILVPQFLLFSFLAYRGLRRQLCQEAEVLSR